MKIILSRKGFDAQYGGVPSPVLPDGTMLSLPIPSYEDEEYETMMYKGRSYMDIIFELGAKRNIIDRGHLDPDIRPNVRSSVVKGWKPIFGQCNAAESHLENQGVTVGDLFLFFGWFRPTTEQYGHLVYKSGTKGVHMLYGYLQVGNIVYGDDTLKYPWHPHAGRDRKKNAMYIASDKLLIDGVNIGLPGAGVFKFSNEIILTMPGMSKSRWKLPDFFKDVEISRHTKDSFKPEGYFQTVAKGQEFVVSEDRRVTNWAKNIILNNIDFR